MKTRIGPDGRLDVEAGTGARDACEIIELTGNKPTPAAPLPPIAAPPALVGEFGAAWRIDLDAARRAANCPPERDATIVHWLVEAPWAHPFWHSYSIVLVHLRPIPGIPGGTQFTLEGATHEMWVWAINAEFDRNRMMAGELKGAWLSPKNFAAQFIEIADDLAARRVQDAVEKVLAGTLSPDVDDMASWARLFGDNMVRDRPGGIRSTVRTAE